jgi:hypothetical protein
MSIDTREKLTDYIYHKLGYPVVEVNVAEEQVDFAIDDALEFVQDYHDDFTDKVYYKYRVTGTEVTLSSNSANSFAVGERVTGANGAYFNVFSISATNKLVTSIITGTLTGNEVITGTTSGFSTTLAASNPIAIGDIQNGYVTLPDGIQTVLKVLPIHNNINSANFIFDVKYQFAQSDYINQQRGDLVYYQVTQDYLSLMEFQFNVNPRIEYNRYTNVCRLDFNWEKEVVPGQYIVFESYAIVDYTAFGHILNDRLFKELCIAKVKRQWGMNTKKYAGVSLPGGVTIQGDRIYQEGTEEEIAIEEEIKRTMQPPALPFFG